MPWAQGVVSSNLAAPTKSFILLTSISREGDTVHLPRVQWTAWPALILLNLLHALAVNNAMFGFQYGETCGLRVCAETFSFNRALNLSAVLWLNADRSSTS